jgi:hypothetical protein
MRQQPSECMKACIYAGSKAIDELKKSFPFLNFGLHEIDFETNFLPLFGYFALFPGPLGAFYPPRCTGWAIPDLLFSKS